MCSRGGSSGSSSSNSGGGGGGGVIDFFESRFIIAIIGFTVMFESKNLLRYLKDEEELEEGQLTNGSLFHGS